MSDLISRADAIEAIASRDETDGTVKVFTGREVNEILSALPSADAERLTDDDIETIRIHLSAIKERLCNQRRWGEAEEYERLIERFMAFAPAQPKTGWIPVSERLPEIGKDVLVTRKYYGKDDGNKDSIYVEISACYADGEEWHGYSDEYKMNPKNHKVIAWMPLPPVYQGE